MGGSTRREVVSSDLVLLALASALQFLGNSATGPVFPRFVRLELDQSKTMVGVIAGFGAIGALMTRPFFARIAAARGTRVLVLVGAMLTSATHLVQTQVDSVGPLFPLRIVMGIGQAAFLVGSTTMAMELVPSERRGEATSYVLVGSQVGLALGPLAGESVLHRWGYHAVWLTSATFMAASLLVAMLVRRTPPMVRNASDARQRWFYLPAVGPGAVFGIGQLGFIGFNTFVSLYGIELGMKGVAPVLMLLSVIVVLIRGFGASLPDRLGPVVGATIALSFMAAGLVTVGAWHAVPGLYVGTAGIAFGSSFLFPSLATAATTGVSDRDRAAAVATFTIFLDLCIGLAPIVNGSLAEAFSYRTMFLVSAAYSLTSLVVLHTIVKGGMRARSAAVSLAARS